MPEIYGISILEDTTARLTFTDVVSPAVSRGFAPAVHRQNTYLARPESAYWVRFKLKKGGEAHLAVRASFLYSEARLFVGLPGGEYLDKTGGLAYPFATREVKTNDLLFSLPPTADEDAYHYMRLRGKVGIGLSFQVLPYHEAFNQSLEEFYFFGFFFGIILIIGACNLILFGVIRQKVYLYYCLYVFSLGLFAVVDWGFLKRLYPYDELAWHRLFWTVPFCAMTAFFLFYTQSLLDTRRNTPKLHRLLNGLIAARIGGLLLTAPLGISFFYGPYLDNAILVVAGAAGIAALKRGVRPARYFLVGLVLVFSGYLVHTLYVFDVFLVGSQFYFYTAALAELLCFSVALADRFKGAEKEKLLARQKMIEQLQEKEAIREKLNRELELKVVQRTAEIERQAAEIARMNRLLQEHNQKLEGQVVDISTARVMQKNVTYEEFREIYPDEEACLKFLDELKWGGGYTCRKCGHGKYTKGKKPYTRRCVQCRYPESVISFTLFGNLKFPIVKAFYMTFLVSSGRDVTVDELSEILSLRRQTCWTFKRKVKEIMQGRRHLRKPSDGWSHLILNVETETVREELSEKES